MTSTGPTHQPELARRLGLGDAVVIGLGSMLGAGVFGAFAPAAGAAGAGLLPGLVLAAAVAYCNATSSARLAGRFPRSGGSYLYGRARLGPWWGFLAGWGFVVGKTASCAAMALTFGTYVAPGHPSVAAAAVTVVLTAVNYCGITRTVGLTRILVAVTLAALVTVIVAALAGGSAEASNLAGWRDASPGAVAESAGLMFFAFAGYARIATLGEEVRDPARTIPRAVFLAFGAAVTVYAVVAVSALAALGPAELAATDAPLAAAARSGDLDALAGVVRVGAAAACAGVLLSLLAGVGRTTLAMARDRELPPALAAVHPRFAVPHRAEIAIGAVVVMVVLITDIRGAIGFSSFAVLTYYAVANASAFGLRRARGRPGRVIPLLGLAGCLLLALSLPATSVLAGTAILAGGLFARLIVRTARNGPRDGLGPGAEHHGEAAHDDRR